LIEDSEHSREWELRESVGGELVGDVVAEFVFAVSSHFFSWISSKLPRIGRIEHVGIKLDAFDDAEAAW
jgi:hypothetical protein